MTRSCIALMLLLFVLTGSLYAIRTAHGQTHLDARLGAARHGLCPLLGDEIHRCGFGLAAHPIGALPPQPVAKGPTLAEQLCPLAFLDAELEEKRAESERVQGRSVTHRDVCIVTFIPLASSVEPPADPYPLYSLLGRPVERERRNWRYLSGHDPLYDAAVYGPERRYAGGGDPAELLPVEVVEACRRPLRDIFAWEDSIEVNFGYRPAQLQQGLGTRGAARTLAKLPVRLHQRLRDSALASHLECQLIDWTDIARRDLVPSPWLMAWFQQQPAQQVMGRPMVTEQVTIGVVKSSSEAEARLVPPVTELPGCELGQEPSDALSGGRITTIQPLPAAQRVIVQSLAMSLDQTGLLLQNASRQLQDLVKN